MIDLIDHLTKRRQQILALALTRLRRDYPRLSDEELMEGIAPFLDQLLAALHADRRADAPDAVEASGSGMRHGEQRHRLRLDPATVVHDYGTICDVIFESATGVGGEVHPRQAQVVNRCVDVETAAAITAYWQKERQSNEKHNVEQLGSVFHELRNALGTARMAFDALAAGRAGVHGRTAAVIARAHHRMQQIITAALEDAHARGSAPVMRAERVELLPLIRDAIDAVPNQRGITVQISVERPMVIEADPRLLVSALSNLVQNALKFTRPSTVVSVRVREEGLRLIVEVEDECGGLGEDVPLFRPFMQRANHNGGVGLGLSIAQHAVHAHGGEIGVRDLPGRGCVFVVTLPHLAIEAAPSLRDDPRH
jgi:signal transduction histidine kinase